MKNNTRNIVVGLTVLAALALLAGLIFMFAGLPWYMQRGYSIKIAATTTNDAHPGDGIHLAGIRIGSVTEVSFTDPADPYKGVTITARIDSGIKLPGNVTAEFYSKGLVGSAYIELKPTGPARIDPATGKAMKYFPTDGSIVMTSRFVSTSVVPKELIDAMKSMTVLADNLNKLVAPTPTPVGAGKTPATGPAAPRPGGIQGTVEKLNLALDAMSAMLGDAENQANIKASLANLAKATQAATKAMNELRHFAATASATAENLSGLAEKVAHSTDGVSRLMATVNRIATKIDQGRGTAGMLLNDPRLYNNFLQATGQINDLMVELQSLVKRWKQQGVKITTK